ncbi:MAG: hypothetical protein K8J31_20165, partial [Anaerolineae bacterium]|nr:hypothetical protein [Anaerolineae bacterium]
SELEAAPTNPLDWLESLTETQAEVEVEEEAPEEPAPRPAAQRPAVTPEEMDIASITDPLAAGIDPMLWLESLAKRQGAKSEEFTTSADMDIPMPEDAVDTGPGYEAFSIENETRDHIAPRKARDTIDPTAWLESMATGSAAEEEADDVMSDDQIRAALAKGADIPADQMNQFFARQLERGLTTEEEPLPEEEEFDQDAPPIPADLPDWLLEQVQPPDDTLPEPLPEDHQPVLLDEIMEPPSVQDLPDWLKVDEQQDMDLELDSIFETADAAAGPEEELEFYSSDPWVQAFEEEASSDPDEVPEWYERNLRDPMRLAAVEQQMGQGVELDDADLPPETRLSQGQPEPVPVWIETEEPVEEEAVEEMADWLSEADAGVISEDIPDWLAAADVEVAPDEIPDWLRDTMETDEAVEEELIISPVETIPEPEPQPEPPPAVIAAPRAVPPKAPPVPIPAPSADVAATLESARTKVSSGSLEESLLDYESIIRANAALDEVVADLTSLAATHTDQPAVYRVLGDGLMRQGRLQDALDTYRKALNQL